MMLVIRFLAFLATVILLFLLMPAAYAQRIASFNLSFNEKGTDSWSSMPLGNGELSAQVWTNPEGGIEMYMGRTDSYDAMDNLIKIGKLSLHFQPNILSMGDRYSETLLLEEGILRVQNSIARIDIRVDASHQLLSISGKSSVPVQVRVVNNIWRKEAGDWDKADFVSGYGDNALPFNPYKEADEVIKDLKGAIGWFHRNRNSMFWQRTMQANELLGEDIADPLTNKTFGAIVSGKGFEALNDTVLQSGTKLKQFQLQVVTDCKQTGSAAEFVNILQNNAAALKNKSEKSLLKAHTRWWAQYWARSYVFFDSDNPTVNDTLKLLNRGYVLQRYVNAVGGRGQLPIKFNGSNLVLDTYKYKIGKVSGKSADVRLWGGPFWWQNTRIMYYPMLASGDYDLIQPFIRFYEEQLRVARIMTKKFYGYQRGARMVETTHSWGVWRGGDMGWDRTSLKPGKAINPYIGDVIIAGLELVNFFLDYHSFTGDESIIQKYVYPFALDVLYYYDQHYQRDERGKMIIAPAQSLETYVGGVNPAPDIAGLKFVIPKLKKIAAGELLDLCNRLEPAIPELPVAESNGKKILAPIESFTRKINVEYPELYAVFPFRLYGNGKKDNDIAIATFLDKQRAIQGWQQTGVQAALLGITDSARRIIIKNGLAFDKRFRFPAFWGPNYDYTPDQCHAGNYINTIQTMLLQSDEQDVHLLPAWPADWNVRFRLHAAGERTVQVEWRNGKMRQKIIINRR